MKKVIVIIVAILLLSLLFMFIQSINNAVVNGEAQYEIQLEVELIEADTLIGKIGNHNLYVYTIDSCEYIGWFGLISSGKVLTHKGDCKYCKERNNGR